MNEEKDFYTRENENIDIKKRFSSLHGKEKWSYFKTYYLLTAIICIGILFILIFLLRSWMQTKNDISIYVGVLEVKLQEESVSELEKNFPDYLNQKDFDVEVFMENLSTEDMSIINVKMGLGGIDIFISEKSNYVNYPTDYFVDLQQVLSKATLQNIEPYLYYSENENGVSYPYAIDLSACSKFQNLYKSSNPVWIAIPSSGLHIEVAAKFIDYLWEE